MGKLFIAGHSDSGDSYLPEGVQPWAERTRAWIDEVTGNVCELDAVRFAPIGPGAPDYLLRRVEAARPDIVVLPLGTYSFAVGTVAESVRVRFGQRAANFFLGAETKFQRRTAQGRVRRRMNKLGRRFARRAFGTRTMASVEQTTAIYLEVLHRLAQIESLQVVAVADARFSAETQARNPGLHDKIDRMHATLFPAIEQHHFLLADLEGALRRAPDRSVFHHDDGVHTTAAFHQVYFETLTATLSELVEPARA